MDPQTALAEILEAMIDGDADEAEAHYDDLRDWLQKGGYQPNWLEGIKNALDDMER